MFDTELKFFATQIFQPGIAVNPHKHPCYELVYYVRGTGIVQIHKTSFRFREETFCICEPQFIHTERYETEVEVMYIGFDILNDSVRLKTGLYEESLFHIRADLQEIMSEMQNKPDYYSRMLNLLTEKILISIIRNNRKNTALNATDDSLLYMVNYIKSNCMKNIDVQFLAQTFGYSYDHFRRMFKQEMGVSAKEYMANERLRYALDLMQNTDYSIKKIAYMSGYSSPSHFGMIFKERFNISPNEYQKQLFSTEQHKEISSYLPGDTSPVSFFDLNATTAAKLHGNDDEN